MEKIFTPEIIVALITGVLSLFTLFIKTNKESKLSRITDERTKWRDEIRNIAKKLSATNQLTENASDSNKEKESLQEILTQLKTRLNSYGKGKNDYLKDSHIWNSISTIEASENNDGNIEYEKNKLIDYLSLLLKHDWERSKFESSVNVLVIIGYSIYIISNALFAYFAYKDFADTTLYLLLIMILMFASLFFMPSLLMSIFKLFNNKGEWSNVFISYGTIIFVLSMTLWQLESDSTNSNIGTLDLPIFLQIIALFFLGFSHFRELKNNSDYKKAVKNIELGGKSKKRMNEHKHKKNKVKKPENEKNNYHPFKCIKLLFVLLFKSIKLLYYIFVKKCMLPIKDFEEKGIRFVDRKISEMKNSNKH